MRKNNSKAIGVIIIFIFMFIFFIIKGINAPFYTVTSGNKKSHIQNTPTVGVVFNAKIAIILAEKAWIKDGYGNIYNSYKPYDIEYDAVGQKWHVKGKKPEATFENNVISLQRG